MNLEILKVIARKAFHAVGYQVVPLFAPDMEKEFRIMYQECKDYTGSLTERMYALYQAIRYIVGNKITGDVVECGVWKGGSMMLCALALKALGETQRQIYMYDTYTGMSEPTGKDINLKGERAIDRWRKSQRKDHNEWLFAPLEEVKEAMYSTGYPNENIFFVKGKVEDTIPKIIPREIALLRLDTDWYESTYHELLHLFPRLSPNGVLILDDYGHHKGAREAVDKYIKENGVKILLTRIDYTGRMAIKVGDVN